MRLVRDSLLLLIIMLPHGGAARGQFLPSRTEIADKIRRAADAADLRADGSPAFHLVASLRYTFSGKPYDGRYELLWASPERFRQNLQVETIREFEIAAVDKHYLGRKAESFSLAFWVLQDGLNSVRGSLLGAARSIGKIHWLTKDHTQGYCEEGVESSRKTEVCFDSTTDAVVHVTQGPDLSDFRSPSSATKELFGVELSEFVALEGKRFPWHIVKRLPGEKIEIRVETLERGDFKEGDFSAPEGIEARPWCAHPTFTGNMRFDSSLIGSTKGKPASAAYYVTVGTDGQVLKSGPLTRSAAFIDSEMAERLRHARFPVESCGGVPVEHERIMYAPIAVPARY